MSTHISNDPASAGADLIHIIKQFSRYLSHLKKSGTAFPTLSKESEQIIRGWSRIDFHSRASTLFQGNEHAGVFIVNSETGFFHGEAGQLFSKILSAMGLSRDDVLIGDICSPENLISKIKSTLPKIIITFGEEAGRVLLGPDFSLEGIRGKFQEFNGIKVMPTFHPSLLLEKPQYKRQVWDDMKRVMAYAGLKHGVK